MLQEKERLAQKAKKYYPSQEERKQLVFGVSFSYSVNGRNANEKNPVVHEVKRPS